MYGHQYTDDEKEFMRSYVPGHTYREIQKAFTEQFGWEITLEQVRAYIKNHKLNTGKTGQFEKGHVPANKGKKMSKEIYEKLKPTMFSKGTVPPNYKPVGSERITKDGYIEIKIEDSNRWKLKHIYVWEKKNGKIPKGYALLFLDGNKQNVNISNLMLIKRSELLIMNRYNLSGGNKQAIETAANLAKLIDAINQAKKK